MEIRNICSLSVFVYLFIFISMKRLLSALLILFGLCFDSGASLPDSQPYGVSIGFGVSGTSGLNGVFAYHDSFADVWWRRYFGVRFDFASTDPLKSEIDSLIESYMRDGRKVADDVFIDNGSLDAWHTSFMLDYYPFGDVWRISGGYTWGGADLMSDIFGVVSDAPSSRFYFYLSGDHYFYDGNDFDGHASINWKYHGPYFGTGVDINIFCGFALYIDIGAVLVNRPARMNLDIPHQQLYIYNKDSDSWSPITIPALDRDVARAEQDANDDFSKIRIYPMLKMGVVYSF